MKTAICYYSRHHGNTRQVLEAMAREGDVELIDVTTRQTVRLERYDCIGFASGIYAFAFHPAVAEFARQYLPLFDLNLGWLLPACLGFVIGLVIHFSGRKSR